jgi:hypothetical protein
VATGTRLKAIGAGSPKALQPSPQKLSLDSAWESHIAQRGASVTAPDIPASTFSSERGAPDLG